MRHCIIPPARQVAFYNLYRRKIEALVVAASAGRIRLLESVCDDLQPVTQAEHLEFRESPDETSISVLIRNGDEFEETIRVEGTGR